MDTDVQSLFFWPSTLFAFQSSESREYLASLECTAVWVAEKVLPFLVPSGHDGEAKEDETTALAEHITKVRSDWGPKQINSYFNVVLLSPGLYVIRQLLLPLARSNMNTLNGWRRKPLIFLTDRQNT